MEDNLKSNELDVDIIREKLKNRKVDWTKHCLNRLQQRDIAMSDVKKAVNNGKIIECYRDDAPYPSCLICGDVDNNITLHIVCGLSNESIHMITAYYPDDKQWEDNVKRRRK